MKIESDMFIFTVLACTSGGGYGRGWGRQSVENLRQRPVC